MNMCPTTTTTDLRCSSARLGWHGSPEPCDRAAARGGFTLVEVLMAAFVLGLGVLGLAAMFAGAARQQQLASKVTKSVSITQSADAMLGGLVGALGIKDCATDPENVRLYGDVYAVPGQWFVVPIRIEGTTLDGTEMSFVSINPDENWTSPDALFFRVTPNQQLPRLAFRVASGEPRIFVGGTGLSLDLGNTGAPILDELFGVPRLLPDSVVMRVVLTGFGCDDTESVFRVDQPITQTLTLTYEGTECEMGTNDDVVLSDGAGNFVLIDQQREVTDQDFNQDPTNESAKITNIYIEGVTGGRSDINCDGLTDYVVSDAGGAPVWTSLGNSGLRLDILTTIGAQGTASYVVDTSTGYKATMPQPYDATAVGKQVLVSTPTGQFTLQNPNNGTDPAFFVRPINADWRYISEIWLDEFEYRGHRLVSAADRVWYTPDPGRETGRRPDVAYSLLYRDRGSEGGPQYIVFTYSLRAASAKGDYVPPERKNDLASGLSPIRLAKGVKMGFDAELLKYYVEAPRNSLYEWVAQPGQVLIFAGDALASTPFNGADSPVTVQFRRGIRGYLESPPRVGNQSLLDLANTDRFDIWAVQPSVKSLDGSEWGLRPIEARVFETFEN